MQSLKVFSADRRLIITLVIVVLVGLISESVCLDADKDNSNSTSVAGFSQDNADIGEDDDFSDSAEQLLMLPCSDLRGYAFHNETKKCWQIGMKGPCPDLMKFYADPENEGYGDCDCIGMRNCIGRPRTYWPNTDRCYFIYSRGPCPQGHWIVFNKDRKPECQKNTCGKQIKMNRALDFLFQAEGKCHKTGTKAFCEEGQTVYISSSDLKPRCYATKPVCRFLIFTAQTLSCRPGSKLDVMGKCVHMREMDEE